MAKKPAKDAVAEVAAAAPAVDKDTALVEAAFAAGNFSMVRALAKTSTSPPAKELAARLMPRVVVERDQVLAGVVAIIVVAIVAALVLVRG
jgi:hypothetical protein